MAIITRCRIPPDSWNGYQRRRSSGEGIPTELSNEMAVRLGLGPIHAQMEAKRLGDLAGLSATGFSAVMGSWKIMLSCAPHTWRSCTSGGIPSAGIRRTAPTRSAPRPEWAAGP